MGDTTAHAHDIERVIRALSSAGKSLRLYPPTSPIPRQSVQAAVDAIDALFSGGTAALSLAVAREGFVSDGEQLSNAVPGVDDLLDELRAHGVACLTLTPGVTADELLTLLSSLMLQSDDATGRASLADMMRAAGCEHVQVAEVQLTVVDPLHIPTEQDTDEFLRELSQDSGRLAAWFEGAAAGDPRSFEESLMELVRVSGPSGFNGLLRALASAFIAQEPESKDVLIGLALEDGPTRDLAGAMFAILSANDIAASVLGGSFGKNMLSLSNALTRLPLEQVTAEVRAEIQAMLPSSGHSAKEAAFLDHMIEVRAQGKEEEPLDRRDRSYRAVIEASLLSEETVSGTRMSVENSKRYVTAAGVRTMLALIQQQQDFALYCTGMDSLAAMVPALVEQSDLALARTVLSEISRRESTESASWPELPERVDAALLAATGPRTMSALVRVLSEDPALLPAGREFMRLARGAGNDELVAAAIELKRDGLAVADELLGGRLDEVLSRQALMAPWHLLGPIAARLARGATPAGQKALGALMQRPDEQSRREVVLGLGESGGEIAVAFMGAALADPSTEVVIAAARGLGRSGSVQATALVADRLGRIDIDNDDFDVVVELIGALAQLPGRTADETLDKLATRRGFMKRARHGEIQDLISRARTYRAQAGGAA